MGKSDMHIDEIKPAGFGKVSFRIVANDLIYRFLIAHEALRFLSKSNLLLTKEHLVKIVEDNKPRIISIALRNKNRCFESIPVLITKSMLLQADAEELAYQSEIMLSEIRSF